MELVLEYVYSLESQGVDKKNFLILIFYLFIARTS